MRTRSPALSDATSASLSGGVTSLIPSAAALITRPPPPPVDPDRSQRHFLVAVGVTFDRDGDGEGGDVAGGGEDVDAERGRVAAVALRPDAEPVRALEDLSLDRPDRRIRVRGAELTEQRLLGQDRRLLERAPDPDADDERRARVRTGRPDALEDPALHTLAPVRRGPHLVLRAVLAAPALCHELEPQGGARHDLHREHGRGV